MYKDLYDRVKKIIKKDTCAKFYDESGLLYLETDASSISLEAALLQVRYGMNCGHEEKVLDNVALCPIAFTTKNILSAKWCYSNVEWEALGILHGRDKVHHYLYRDEAAKYSVVNTLYHRAKAICSNQQLLGEEEDHL